MSVRQSNYTVSNRNSELSTPPSSVLSQPGRLRRQPSRNSWKDYLLPEVSEKFKEIKRASEGLSSQQNPESKLTKVTSADRFVHMTPNENIRVDVLQD